MWFVKGLAALIWILALASADRGEIARAWRYRTMFPPAMFWGVPALYVIAGVLVSAPAFGMVDLNISVSSPAVQVLAGLGVVSIAVVWFAARRLATPVFEAHAVAHKDRNAVHGLWGMFWIAGLILGVLPTLFR